MHSSPRRSTSGNPDARGLPMVASRISLAPVGAGHPVIGWHDRLRRYVKHEPGPAPTPVRRITLSWCHPSMPIQRHILTLSALFLAATPLGPLAAQTTRPERTDARETSTYADVLGFIDSLARRGAPIRIGSLGESPEGRRIPWVLAARPMVEGPSEAWQTGKPVIYVQGNIHSGEVEGKEAAQMLLRDLTLGPLRPLLDSVVLLVVPIYNADGNEQWGPGERNRPGQNGPAVVGRSLNGQGLNLNRDYVKAEAPETRAALAMLETWDPDVFIDLHTTNGSYH